MWFKTALFLLCSFAGLASHAEASLKLTPELTSEITVDLQENFANKLTAAALMQDSEPTLTAKDQRVMLKALYAGVEGPLSLAGIDIDEQKFNREVGRVLLAASKYGVLPAAITIGYFSRAQLLVGRTFGSEMNFYLSDGKLKVSTYDLRSVNVGLAGMLKVGFYVALCFGSCTGGDVNGSYIGIDADVILGAGSNFYVEVGLDTTDAGKAFDAGTHYSVSDLYSAKAFYIGTGIDIGIGAGMSGFYQSYTMTNDIVIADLYAMLDKPDFTKKMRSAFERANLFKSAPRLP